MITAGGSVLVGDVFRPTNLGGAANPDPISGDEGGDFCFSLAQASLFNRDEWARTQPLLPGPGEDPADPMSWTAVNPDYQGPSYLPRYYCFSEDGTIPIYNKGQYFDVATESWAGGDPYPDQWDTSLLTYADPDDPSDPLLFDAGTGAAIAAVHYMTPSDGWMSKDIVQKFISTWIADKGAEEELEIDGLLYTNNMIVGYVPRVGPYDGKLIVSGSLIASDMGFLANGDGTAGTIGLQLNYDPRVTTMLNLVTPSKVTLRRTLWNPTANVLQ